MTLLQLLQRAEVLSRWLPEDVDLTRLREEVEAGEKQVAMQQEALGAYEQSRDAVVLDGTPLSIGMWRECQRHLTGCRVRIRRGQEALQMIQEELERLVAIGTHRKAMQAREEVRA